jgi:hypothetical protein
LKIYTPAAVIVGLAEPRMEKTSRNRIMKAMKLVAANDRIQVISIARSKVTRHFQHHALTKYDVARAVARVVPELAWQLPKKRKPWESEHSRMSIFAAAALVLTHMFSQNTPGPTMRETVNKPGLTLS